MHLFLFSLCSILPVICIQHKIERGTIKLPFLKAERLYSLHYLTVAMVKMIDILAPLVNACNKCAQIYTQSRIPANKLRKYMCYTIFESAFSHDFSFLN